MNAFWQVAALRFALLWKQRLGWMAAAAGAACVILSWLFADVSFQNPVRIFWDFALGGSFVLQAGLVTYLGSQLFFDEKNRRTLHLLLASGVPRSAWLAGNAFGLWAAVAAMNLLWLLLAGFVSYSCFGVSPAWIVFEAQWAVAVEMLVVVATGLLFSLWVRPVLAFAATLAGFVFLHSVGAVERIFADRESGRLIRADGVKTLLHLARFLPPLEWFDLRVFVGYQNSVPPATLGTLTLLGFLWALLLIGFAVWRFEGMDL